MFNEEITLVGRVKTVNQYGDQTYSETFRPVFARVESIGYNEFYQASATGFKPEIKFVLPDYLEYNGEEIVEYQQFNQDSVERYRVIRTYRKNNLLEMVCQRGVDK